MQECQCYFCGLFFVISPGQKIDVLVCTECGTEHTCNGEVWRVFRAGPQFRTITAEEREQHFQRMEKLAKIVESRRIAEEEAQAASRARGPVPLRINLLPFLWQPRLRNWFYAQKIGDTLGLILFAPPFFIVYGFLEVRKRLPYYRRRQAEKEAQEEAERKIWRKRREEEWLTLPLSALTSQAPFDRQKSYGEERGWKEWQARNADFHQWLGGVTCGHCSAKGSLCFDWVLPYCPLCKQEPFEASWVTCD